MRKIFIILLLTLFISSCATLINKDSYKILVNSNHPETKIYLIDSTHLYLPHEIEVERSNKDLTIRLVNGMIAKDFIVKPSLDPIFLYGNVSWGVFCPIGYFVDYYNPKRYYYGNSLDLNIYDSVFIIEKKARQIYVDYFTQNIESNKGQLDLLIGVPIINNFYWFPENEPLKSKTGSWGISFGLDYYYKKSKFLNLSASALMDLTTLAESFGYIDEEILGALSLNLTDNHKISRLSLGYGMNYTIKRWYHSFYEQIESPSPIKYTETKLNHSFGISLTAYHRIWKKLYIGIDYRPTFINVYPKLDYKYEHTFSLSLAFRLPVK